MYPVSNINSAPVLLSKVASTAALEERRDMAPLAKSAESSTPKISTLARQLSECAERAVVRDKTLSRDALRDLASRLSGQLSCARYTKGDITKVFARSSTDAPELIERDRQAVLYSISSIYRENSVPSPFSGLSREELVLIAYDDTNTFTVNERYAARRDAYQLEQNFREDYCRRSSEGAFNQHPFLGYAEILTRYRSIPLIEQVQYSEDYEARIESWMLEAWAEKPRTDSREFKTLFEILAEVVRDRDHLPVMESGLPEPAESSTTTQPSTTIEPFKPHGSSSDGGTAHVSS
jgi:hypothetical protein